MGGLSRRATVQQGFPKPLVVVEAGNWGWKSSLLPQSKRAQQRRKASLQLNAMKLSGIDAIGLGSGDLALGLDFFMDNDASFVLSNVSCGAQDSWKRFQRVDAGGTSIGILSVLSTTSTVPIDCTITSPHEAAKEIAHQQAVDLWVVSAELSQEESRTVASALGHTLFIDSKSRRMGTTPKKVAENAALLSAGSRGKHVGLVSVHIPKDASGLKILGLEESVQKERKRYQDRIDKATEELKSVSEKRDRNRLERQIKYYSKKIEEMPVVEFANEANPWIISNTLHGLGKDIANHKETEGLVEAYKEREEEVKVQTKEEYNGPFLGSNSCMGCHPYQYKHWESTAHAKAWQTLVDDKRSQDQACFSCHVTGAHHPQGPQSIGQIQGLENVGCESCHGPGKAHVESSGQVDMIKEPDVQNCTQCHDGVKDEGRFDAATYYPKIRHPALGAEGEQ